VYRSRSVWRLIAVSVTITEQEGVRYDSWNNPSTQPRQAKELQYRERE
jgi:hypothetical protein